MENLVISIYCPCHELIKPTNSSTIKGASITIHLQITMLKFVLLNKSLLRSFQVNKQSEDPASSILKTSDGLTDIKNIHVNFPKRLQRNM